MDSSAAAPATHATESARPIGTMLIPAYNEEAMIAGTLRRLDVLCQRLAMWDWEIVVVDDGSTDATAVVVTGMAAECHTPVRLLRHSVNRRLGGALRTGILASRGEIVITADCDLSYSEDCLTRLAETYDLYRPEIVIASPYMPGGRTREVPFPLEVRSRAANKWLRMTSLDDLHTLTGMVRAYRGDFVRAMALKAVDVDINAEILYKAQVLRAAILEIPATLDWSHLRTRAGRSRLLAKRARTNTVKQLINGYLWRPFMFPLFAGAFFLAVALILTVTGNFSRELAAVSCWTVGIVLVFQMLTTLQAKRYFEELYVVGHQVRSVLPAPVPMASESLATGAPSAADARPASDPARRGHAVPRSREHVPSRSSAAPGGEVRAANDDGR